MEKAKLKVAILLNKYNYEATLHPDDMSFLKTFADIINIGKTPDAMDESYITTVLPSADVCITGWGTPMLTKSILEKAPGLKLIAHAAGTPKAIANEETFNRGIRVFTCAPIIAIDVAESTLGAIIYSLKRMHVLDNMVRTGIWADNANEVNNQKYLMRRLNYRLTVGIVSASHVGRNLMKMLQPFGVKIKLFDPYVTDFKAKELNVEKVSLEELMSTSDVVTIHSPNLPETKGMITAKMFALMKDGALFVNTSRSPIIDEAALIKELESGRINAYLDVYSKEPLPKDSPLLKLDNVLLTPHISGGHTLNGSFERGNYIVQQLYSYHTTSFLKDEAVLDMLATMA